MERVYISSSRKKVRLRRSVIDLVILCKSRSSFQPIWEVLVCKGTKKKKKQNQNLKIRQGFLPKGKKNPCSHSFWQFIYLISLQNRTVCFKKTKNLLCILSFGRISWGKNYWVHLEMIITLHAMRYLRGEFTIIPALRRV